MGGEGGAASRQPLLAGCRRPSGIGRHGAAPFRTRWVDEIIPARHRGFPLLPTHGRTQMSAEPASGMPPFPFAHHGPTVSTIPFQERSHAR